MQRVGFIGLGAMGAPMAWNLHKAGYPLGVYNRSPARTKPFAEAGITVHETPRALAAASEVVITMVSDPGALRRVLFDGEGLLNGLVPGAYVINMSTVDHAATLQAAKSVAGHGGRFVDAPVSGTVKPAEEGTLTILAGAAEEDLQAVEPLLRCMAREIVHCGGVGQGTRMKLVVNLMLGGMMALLAEGLTLAGAFELKAEDLLAAVAKGPMNAPLYQAKGRMMAAGRFQRQFPVELMFKDLNLLLAEAGAAGVPLPTTAAVRELFSAARALGHGGQDMAAVVRVLQRLSGPRP